MQQDEKTEGSNVNKLKWAIVVLFLALIACCSYCASIMFKVGEIVADDAGVIFEDNVSNVMLDGKPQQLLKSRFIFPVLKDPYVLEFVQNKRKRKFTLHPQSIRSNDSVPIYFIVKKSTIESTFKYEEIKVD